MKWRLHFQFGLFFPPKLCRDALIPIHQSRIALVQSHRFPFFCCKVSPALAVTLSQWVTRSLTASSFIPFFPKSLPFSHSFFVLRIYHPGDHKINHEKMAFLWMLKLLYLSLGLFRAKIRHWCKCGSSTDNEKHAYYFFLKYIYSYQLFQFLSPNSPKSLSVPELQLGSMRRVFTGGGGWEDGYASGFYISISFNISTALSPHVLCLSLLPPERDCLADSPKRKCAKWTWQIPGWLHMARSELDVTGIPKLLSPY